MFASTHRLELDPAVSWRLVGIPKARRQASTVVGDPENVFDRECATGDGIVSRSYETRIQPGLGDAMEFALFALTLAAIGRLHVELLALFW